LTYVVETAKGEISYSQVKSTVLKPCSRQIAASRPSVWRSSVKAAEIAVKLTNDQFRAGAIDYTPVFIAEQFLAQQQNVLAQA